MVEKKTNSEKTNPEAVSDEILYQGNQVPKFLRYVYAAFVVWAVGYFLIVWLT